MRASDARGVEEKARANAGAEMREVARSDENIFAMYRDVARGWCECLALLLDGDKKVDAFWELEYGEIQSSRLPLIA
jgi:hypothetical protein